MKNLFILFVLITTHSFCQFQIGDNVDPTVVDESAVLDVDSKTDGILIPSFTKEERENLEIPEDNSWEGMIVYDLTHDTIAYVGKDNNWMLLVNEEF